MNKALLLCSFTVLTVHTCFSQTKGTLNLSLGPAIPVGPFASKDGNAVNSGLAKTGATVNFSYHHPFKQSRLGWMVTLRGAFYGVDKSASFIRYEALSPGYYWRMNNSRWTETSVLAGLDYLFPIDQKLSFSASLQMGVGKAWSPQESILGLKDSVGFGPNDITEATLHSSSAYAFTAQAGLGINYQWRRRWAFLANVNYVVLEPRFKNVYDQVAGVHGLIIPGLISLSNTYNFPWADYQIRSFRQPMSSLTITAGIAWTL